MYRFIGICVCLAFAQHVLATTNVNQWLWLDTSEDLSKATSNVHQPHFTQMGTPHSIVNISEQLDSYLLDSFYAMVPEGQRVSSDLLENTFNNISVKADFEGEVTVKVAFLNEGAGYKNTLGYFIYPTDTPPQRNALDEIEHVVIFPNASKVRSGGELHQGDQVDLKINFLVLNVWHVLFACEYRNYLGVIPRILSVLRLNSSVTISKKVDITIRHVATAIIVGLNCSLKPVHI